MQYRYKLDSHFFLFAILQIYILGSIFYVFRSGLPQPADFLLAFGILLGALIFFTRPTAAISNTMIYAGLFAAYTFLVNIINYLHIPDQTFLFSSLYYVFNVGAFFFVIFLARLNPQDFNKKIYWLLFAAVIIQFVAVYFIFNYFEGRPRGTFNNPNQLSYWALISLCLLGAIRYPTPFKPFDYLMVFLLLLISMASLSKGGLIAFIVVLLGMVFTPLFGSKARIMVVFLCSILFIYALNDLALVSENALKIEEISKAYDRFANIGDQQDDNLEQRGYTRIVEHPEYLILGAGEGGYHRFSSFPHEFHSGIGTLIFSYGFLGTIFLGLFLFSFFKRLPAFFWVMLFAIFLYGLTHQNMRFTYSWVFLGTCYWASLRYRKPSPVFRPPPVQHAPKGSTNAVNSGQ